MFNSNSGSGGHFVQWSRAILWRFEFGSVVLEKITF